MTKDISKIQEQYNDIVESLKNNGAPGKRLPIAEVLTTADLNMAIPKAIEVIMLEAAEPEYLASKFVKQISITDGRSIEFVNFGALRAGEVSEGGEYPNQSLDAAKFGGKATVEVKVKKYGIQVDISDEVISDSQWDILGMHITAAGKAMARKQEEVIFNEFSQHGHVVFDADTGGSWAGTVGASKYTPNATGLAPTGRGFDGEYNATLSAQDFIDMCLSIMAAGFTPTDVIMHPLCYSLFRSNEMLYNALLSAGAFGGGATGSVDMSVPAPGAYSLPVSGLQVSFSPYVPFSHADRKFDIYIIDRNNAGVLVTKDPISLDQFNDPKRDILSMKVKSRYGVGTINGGLGIAVAKNIRFAKTWPMPGREFAAMAMPSDMTNANMDKVEDRSLITPVDGGPTV